MDYTTHRNAKGGVRFDVHNVPMQGTQILLTDGRLVTYLGQGTAGMLLCADSNDCELLIFPQQFASVHAQTLDQADLTHI